MPRKFGKFKRKLFARKSFCYAVKNCIQKIYVMCKTYKNEDNIVILRWKIISLFRDCETRFYKINDIFKYLNVYYRKIWDFFIYLLYSSF